MVYSTPVLLQAFTTPSPRILTMLHQSVQNTALVARADRGIRTAQDLRGKTVGYPRDTSAEFFLRTLLEFAGVGWDEVRIADVRAEDVPDALAAGRVDAVAIWTPLCDRAARALGPAGAVTLRSDVFTDVSMLVTRPEVVASRRAALESTLRALIRAQQVASSDPERLFGTLRNAFPEVDPVELRTQLQRIDLRLGASHLLLQRLRSEAEWFARAGRLPAASFDLRALVATAPLDAVDPDLVTLEAQP
jgi:NitT/TauT family transport system substrate-binding protein